MLCENNAGGGGGAFNGRHAAVVGSAGRWYSYPIQCQPDICRGKTLQHVRGELGRCQLLGDARSNFASLIHSFRTDDLKPDTDYNFSVVAVDGAGEEFTSID